MKSDKNNGKTKSSKEKEHDFKTIKKIPSKTKVNVKSSKFWDDIYQDDPEMESFKVKTR